MTAQWFREYSLRIPPHRYIWYPAGHDAGPARRGRDSLLAKYAQTVGYCRSPGFWGHSASVSIGPRRSLLWSASVVSNCGPGLFVLKPSSPSPRVRTCWHCSSTSGRVHLKTRR
jgi:hypothetical protein